MELWQLAVFGAAIFLLSILSGIAGAGAGFIATPLAILLGLTPAQAVATGKFNGLAVATGSLSGMARGAERVSKWRIIPVMVLAFVIGLAAPLVIKSLENDFYRITLGVVLLLMVPVVIYKHVGVKSYHPKLWQKYAGAGLLTLALFLQGVFSGGLGSLVNLVLMGMLGMNAIEANITKRWSQLILNATIILSLIGSGYIIWNVAVVGFGCALVGSFIGGHMAAKRGNGFIMRVMVVLMIAAGLGLLFGVG
jgi:uncharacterized membrane protein YfcA